MNFYVGNLVNQRLQNALNNTTSSETSEEIRPIEDTDGIITTAEELESYYIVKSILSEFVNPNELSYKDTYSYFGILYENKVTQWICRVYLKENVKFVIIPDKNKKEIRHEINDISDIYKLKEQLIARLKTFTDK